MGISIRYKELKNEVLQLRRNLLPKRFLSSGQYKEEWITRTVAYRVLVHAEIEAYLEDRSRDVALTAVKAWKERNKASKTLLALIAFSGMKMEKPPSSMSPEQPSQAGQWDEKIELRKKIDLALAVFHSVLNNNNGIKEENIMRLLLPIGVDCGELDTVLVADLNSYGASRGLVAHKGFGSYRTTEQIDPKEDLKKVRSLVTGIGSIDRIFEELLADL
jgi:hypothetical protein